MGFADEAPNSTPQVEEPEVPENDPTEYIPVMRHHLHEMLMAVEVARGRAQAEDLADAYRHGEGAWRTSKMTGQLTRASDKLRGYLGLLDYGDEDAPRDAVSENE